MRSPSQPSIPQAATAVDPEDCSSLLLPLFRSLTELAPSCVVWKNTDMALSGVGDVDCMAPQVIWSSIIAQVRLWASEAELGPVIVCNHVPDGMFVIALNGTDEFFQLDVRSRVSFRGSAVFRAEDLAHLAQMDRRGFRRLRPGAEGLLKLVLKGIAWGGRPRLEKLRSEGVVGLIDQDIVGVRQAAELFKPVSNALVSAAESFRDGRWDSRTMLALEVVCCLKALTHPQVALGRARSRARGAARCPVVEASIKGSRRLPADDYTSWLSRVSEFHPVFDSDAAP